MNSITFRNVSRMPTGNFGARRPARRQRRALLENLAFVQMLVITAGVL